jgi:carotenoid cleavage dioxygenase-like enzyme
MVTSRRQLLTDAASIAGTYVLSSGICFATEGTSSTGTIEAWRSESPFLTGAFAPVFDERDDLELAVVGKIPQDLHGVFMRNGPNPQFLPDAHYAYPFDGTGMVHAIYLEDGRARYRNRWVRTLEFTQERSAGHRLFNSSFSPPPHADLANTNIIRHGGKYLALYEGGIPYEINKDLETAGAFTYEGMLPSVMSAHPKQDPKTGELLALAYSLKAATLTYLRADRAGQLDRAFTFQAPWAAMVHDIAITEHHLVAFVCPLVFEHSKPGPPASWQPQRNTRVLIIPRDARSEAEARWFEVPPFFQFHVVNAFAEHNRIELVVPWYDSYSLTHPAPRLELHRLVLNIDSGKFEDQMIDSQPCEFGRVNEAHLGRRAQFGYVGLRDPRPGEKPQIGAFESFARYDLVSGAKTVHQFPAGVTVCEPVFVASSRRRTEDDGYLLSFAHDANSNRGLFVILDARDVSAKPLATVQLPRRVPAGLHGSWLPG